jgi:hypothetical protein
LHGPNKTDRVSIDWKKGVGELRLFVSHAIGLSTTTELRTRDLDDRQEQGEARHKRMDERVSDIERRLANVEQKLDA